MALSSGSTVERFQAQLGAFCRSARAAAERDVSHSDSDGVVAELRQLLSAHAALQQHLSAAPAHDTDAEEARGASCAVEESLQRFMLSLDEVASKLRDTLDACAHDVPAADYSFEARDVVRLAHRIRNNASMMIRPPKGDGVVEPPMPPAPQKWDMQASQLQRFNERQQQLLRAEAQGAQQRQQQAQAQPGEDLSDLLKKVFSRGQGDRQFEQLRQIMNQLTATGWTLQEFARGNVPPLLAAFLRASHQPGAEGAAPADAAAASAPLARQPSAAAAAPAAAAAQAQAQEEEAEAARPQDGFTQALQTSVLPSWMLDEDEDDDDY
jgi:hypothetical protein